MKRLKLYCIPHAGGLAGYYHKITKHLDAFIEVHPIELAGRGIRKDEDFYDSFDSMVGDVYKIINSDIGLDPYLLFGHSMGGLIAYELCLRSEKNKGNIPGHVFFSSIYPPYINEPSNVENISDEALKGEIIKWGGTSTEILSDPKLASHFLPIIKADLKLIDGYVPKNTAINTNISVLWGNEDKEPDKMKGWKNITNNNCSFSEFEGNHFYINDNLLGIAKIINSVAQEFKTLA